MGHWVLGCALNGIARTDMATTDLTSRLPFIGTSPFLWFGTEGGHTRPEVQDQPYAPLPGEEGVAPLHQDAETIPESGQIEDVHKQPEKPCRDAAEGEPRELRQSPVAADHGEIAVRLVAERFPVLAQQIVVDVSARTLSHLNCALRDARNRFPLRIVDRGLISGNKNFLAPVQ